MVKNLLCNAGDVGSIPSGGAKSPRAVVQLEPMQPACRAAMLTAGSEHLRACEPHTLHLRSTAKESMHCRGSWVQRLRPDAAK